MTLGPEETATKETLPNAKSFGHDISVDAAGRDQRPLTQRLWTLVVVHT
jgi:hypothetical protein